MDASLEHKKDPAVGWNILASAKAENNERISRAQILVNGFSKYDQSFTAPITSKAEAAARFFTRRSFTTPAALAGLPALAVPCGFSAAGLPLSLQIMGRRFEDATVLRVGHAYEQTTEWHLRRPAL